ncbi:MAG: site-2 protease family protein [Candidatus Liptonbacteria bacterium]|nr:site-2 protease family protein [Candidatus Liptonbacteria bacterium]
MDSISLLIFELLVLVFSVVIHEVSHGAMAEKLGDPTARLLGRLTLNPIPHIDPIGSLLLPAVLWFISGGTFIVGWAKPVPYNPWNLKNPVSAAAKIAFAGPAANLALAVAFGIFLRFAHALDASAPLLAFFGLIVQINILLAVFNLVPLPPLDGSKVLYALLPRTNQGAAIITFLERNGMILLLVFIFFGFDLIIPVMRALFFLFTGLRL